MDLDTRNTTGYETVAASQTAQVLGPTGALGDYLDRLIVTVATAATGISLAASRTASATRQATAEESAPPLAETTKPRARLFRW